MLKQIRSIVLLFAIVLSGVSFCGDSLNVSNSDIQNLIDKLASPNKDPHQNNRSVFKLPENYDQEAQKTVWCAEYALISLGKRAFPLLIKNSHDNRYSKSVSYSRLLGHSVGEVCLMIIDRQVCSNFGQIRNGYKTMPDYGQLVIRRNPEKWWAENSELTIYEMQIKALGWTIEQEKKNYPCHIAEMLNYDTQEKWNTKIVKPLEDYLDMLPKIKNTTSNNPAK